MSNKKYQKYEKSFGEFVEDVLNDVKFYHLDCGYYFQCMYSKFMTLEGLKESYDIANLHVIKRKPSLKDYLNDGGSVLIIENNALKLYKGDYYEGIGDLRANKYEAEEAMKYVWSNIEKELSE